MAEWRKIVATNTIDAALLQKMFLAGAKNLEAKKEWINDLNVGRIFGRAAARTDGCWPN